jgi:hypothetical protein
LQNILVGFLQVVKRVKSFSGAVAWVGYCTIIALNPLLAKAQGRAKDEKFLEALRSEVVGRGKYEHKF